jgi:hypothetical protein
MVPICTMKEIELMIQYKKFTANAYQIYFSVLGGGRHQYMEASSAGGGWQCRGSN